ncbi:probable glutamine--tRNA ligase [Anopheles cruzii]|uniref:probable glutamine--tRNA ligase n=1 Tax=Anopheles cruzii TaxID=68878 RepID=UPI0022EC6089|nr:probable glutamine--tRNA ligase [Anopheles cruzii]
MEHLQALGLSDQKIKDTLKNASLTGTISRAFSYLPSNVELSASQKSLLFQMCSKLKPQSAHFLEMLVRKIHTGALDTSLRVDTALEYVLTNVAKTAFDEAAFDKACGVGVVVTPEEVECAVEKTIAKHRQDIVANRYGFNVGKLLTEIRSLLPWVDGKALKCEVDVQMFDLLGPKTEADNAQGKKKREKPGSAEDASKIVASKLPEQLKATSSAQHEERPFDGPRTMVDLMRKVDFHRPGENFKTDGYVVTSDTERLLKEHVQRTGGKVRTRFPPEPNGILHIGHAKAININFAFAAANDGVCFLRYDDTNPEKEEEKFVRGIRDIVEWLGYSPFKVTYSSDYFQQLYEFAIQLISKNLAYFEDGAEEPEESMQEDDDDVEDGAVDCNADNVEEEPEDMQEDDDNVEEELFPVLPIDCEDQLKVLEAATKTNGQIFTKIVNTIPISGDDAKMTTVAFLVEQYSKRTQTTASGRSPQGGQFGDDFLHLIFPSLVAKTAYQLFYTYIAAHVRCELLERSA